MITKIRTNKQFYDNPVEFRHETEEQRYHRRIGQTDRMNIDEDNALALRNAGALHDTVTMESRDGMDHNSVTPVPQVLREKVANAKPGDPVSVSTANLPLTDLETKPGDLEAHQINPARKGSRSDSKAAPDTTQEQEEPYTPIRGKDNDKPLHRTAHAGR